MGQNLWQVFLACLPGALEEGLLGSSYKGRPFGWPFCYLSCCMEEPFFHGRSDSQPVICHVVACYAHHMIKIGESISEALVAMQPFSSSPLPGPGLCDLLQRVGSIPSCLRVTPSK